ncbi:sigma-54 dependent transcriptional regulator [Pseudodesulfovibrio sp. zrk46]|uniref:sigma-54-dependent transcriptional regulator n=1 Tax=Pseudodesulfovibrio sp. zrk46 TaxID=2725288 RepID=UPI0014497DF5|nr:sigma-54 dependent transcriptional regulator [Pseudodesulfovibrio sp. zrk46]QJB57547.1 sigma-54-dependent Fis family transcriptional regulator [Pseudodesulfovibrio sp. zrk46]
MNRSVGILLVDDEKDFAVGMARLIGRQYPEERIKAVHSGEEALAELQRDYYGLMLTDLNMPGMDGVSLLTAAKDAHPELSVVMLTAYGTVAKAVDALKIGAYDFLTKPVESGELFQVIQRGLERSSLLRDNARLQEMVEQYCGPNELVGDSYAIRRLKDGVAAVAESDYTVLIRGESGTGKELVARTIHKMSKRRNKPMLTVNCPAIPDQLLESELFGHVKGAFTGADRDRKGIFASANGGTLLLDEIGDISPGIQTKLLRALQEGEIRPVGSSKTIPVDVRILASTNQPLEDKIKDNSFREDLYYRLNVLNLNVPALRERSEDIAMLTHHFLESACDEMKISPKEITPDAVACLVAKPWPGNVRELQNFIRRLAVFSPSDTIELAHIRLVEGLDGVPESGAQGLAPYKDAKEKVVDDFTRAYVEELLTQAHGNVSEAARRSGLSRVALQKILKRLEIDAVMFK